MIATLRWVAPFTRAIRVSTQTALLLETHLRISESRLQALVTQRLKKRFSSPLWTMGMPGVRVLSLSKMFWKPVCDWNLLRTFPFYYCTRTVWTCASAAKMLELVLFIVRAARPQCIYMKARHSLSTRASACRSETWTTVTLSFARSCTG